MLNGLRWNFAPLAPLVLVAAIGGGCKGGPHDGSEPSREADTSAQARSDSSSSSDCDLSGVKAEDAPVPRDLAADGIINELSGSDAKKDMGDSTPDVPDSGLPNGDAVPGDGPVAVIEILEGSEVIPQCVVHLLGDKSYSPNGKIVAWNWSLEAPPLAAPVFVPSSGFPDPTIEANVAGIYTFRLSVQDETGATSLVEAEKELIVVPCCFGFSVDYHPQPANELEEPVWQVDWPSGEPPDMDLHMLGPGAVGKDIDGDGVPDGWFDELFDLFWLNPDPQFWGPGWCGYPAGPGLWETDDGYSGISYCVPPHSSTYPIAVHYWSDHDNGDAAAWVSVTGDCAGVSYQKAVKLSENDFWIVGTVNWGTFQFEPAANADGTPVVVHGVVGPELFGFE